MNIVQFENDQYALRKGNWLTGYQYLDLKSYYDAWWPQSSMHFKDCLTDNKSRFDIYIMKIKS